MSRAPRELTPHLSQMHHFGAEVRRWRIVRGLSVRALASKIPCSHSLLSMVETAQRWPHMDLAIRLDECLGTGQLVSVGALLEQLPDHSIELRRLCATIACNSSITNSYRVPGAAHTNTGIAESLLRLWL